MKRLEPKYRGWLVANSPQDELERHVYEDMGYVQLPTGQWIWPDQRPGPSVEVIEKNPYGHVCRACRSRFRSKRYHDAFCGSCRSTMANTRRVIEAVLDASTNGAAEVQAAALRKVKAILECPWCFWQANEGRHEPKNFDLIREYLSDWIVASHCHWMHHNFWNRFPSKSKFVPKKDWEQHVTGLRLLRSLEEQFRKQPPVLELARMAEVEVPIQADGGITSIEIPIDPRNRKEGDGVTSPGAMGEEAFPNVPKAFLRVLAGPSGPMLRPGRFR